MGNASAIRNLKVSYFNDKKLSVPMISDILKELDKPAHASTPGAQTTTFTESVETLNDLRSEMILEGLIINLTNFGACIDIGIQQNGLVYTSSLADKVVEDPHTVMKFDDIIKVKVMKVNLQRKDIALSMCLDKQPGKGLACRSSNPREPAQNNLTCTATKRPNHAVVL